MVGLRFRPRREGRSGQSPELFLALARDASGVKEAVATLQGLLLVVGLATVGIVWAVLAVVVGRSLRPLEALSAEVAGIGQETLATRLEPGRVPAELVPVVERVNELLARLEVAFARERSFSDDVAHELRTPLAGLRATLEVAEARPRSPADYAAALRTGADLAAQLQGLVDRLLQLARLEGRTRAFEARPCDLADASLEAWEPLAGEAQARELTVAWQLEPGLEAEADPDLLGLILRNLFENAVHYADGGGRVRVHTADASGAVAVTVANTGSRLSDSQARQATARFWRGDDARREAGLHCGLGLSLVERAAVALGGRLELRSTAGGEFSATVVLPGGPGAPAPDAGARVAAEVG